MGAVPGSENGHGFAQREENRFVRALLTFMVSAPSRPSRVRMILVLGALIALGPLTIDMYLPALPRIAEELDVTSSVIQLTLTGTLAGLALGQLIVGPLSDSLGRRRR